MPSHLTVSDRVREILVNTLDISPDLILSESAIYRDLGADYGDLVDVGIAIEEEFGLTDFEEVTVETTVAQLIQTIQEKIE